MPNHSKTWLAAAALAGLVGCECYCCGGRYNYLTRSCVSVEEYERLRLRPGACPANVEPVCGCDLHTYSNNCHAYDDAAGVLHPGGCLHDWVGNLP